MRPCLFLLSLSLVAQSPSSSKRPYLQAPAGDDYAVHNPAGITILPNGRFLQPAGTHHPLAKYPHGMVISRDGQSLFIASDGVGQLVANWQSASPKISELNPPQARGRAPYASQRRRRRILPRWQTPLLEQRRTRNHLRL